MRRIVQYRGYLRFFAMQQDYLLQMDQAGVTGQQGGTRRMVGQQAGYQ